jgi:putative DNA primase/helicase
MLGKLGIDVDPRHGGDTSVYDLCEKYGREWLDEAWRNVSGSGGPHFIFDNQTGISFKNSASKIGPGIDTRGDEGYLVMPPSLHVSGQRYAVISPSGFPPVPQFIIDALSAPKSESEVVFQDGPTHGSASNRNEKYLDGHRNDGLLAYGLGRMRYAWERTEDEHYSQLSRVNQLRCVPPLDDDEVRDLAAHIANDYAYLYGANVGEKGKAA